MAQSLSNVQLELLKLFTTDVPEEDLRVIKQLLIRYKAERLMNMADEAWEAQQWDDQKIEALVKGHFRTAYKQPGL